MGNENETANPTADTADDDDYTDHEGHTLGAYNGGPDDDPNHDAFVEECRKDNLA